MFLVDARNAARSAIYNLIIAEALERGVAISDYSEIQRMADKMVEKLVENDIADSMM